ncbi:MAG: low molecular weight protein-tyrosine-phosphatase [Halioglobus sp.]
MLALYGWTLITGDIALALFKHDTRVLFICTENICRSPLAEGLLQHHLQHSDLRNRVKVSSAGTRTSQPGCRPDQRARKVAADAGINLGRIRAGRVTEQDLVRSDYVIAMDKANMRDLMKLCPPEQQYKISLLLSHLPGHNLDEVPDPYYGSIEGFDRVFQLIDSAVEGLISHIEDSMP